MTLPSSGQISMSQINTELGRTSTAEISLDTAENGGYATINTCSPSYPSSGNPASMSEWYSYNHAATCCPIYGTYLGFGCEYNPSNFCIEYVDIYADGNCGTYYVYCFCCVC